MASPRGGNGNPLQYSCLENPVDRRAWWAAIDGVAQSRTWLTRLSSSSSKDNLHIYPKQDKNINHLIFSIQSSHEAVGKKIYLCIFTLFQIITLLETDFWIGSFSHPIFTYEYTIQGMPSPYYTKTGRDIHSLYDILKYAHLSIEVLPIPEIFMQFTAQ